MEDIWEWCKNHQHGYCGREQGTSKCKAQAICCGPCQWRSCCKTTSLQSLSMLQVTKRYDPWSTDWEDHSHGIVRCDVVESGVPCTNCRLDEVDCCVSDSKRRKKSMADGECTNHSPGSSLDESDEALPQFPGYDAANDIAGWSAPPDDQIDQPLPSTQLEAELSRHVPHMLCMYCLVLSHTQDS